MDFTRQPIIETVISPKDGYKLLIRNSKEANQEEFLVNAIEIVSFGNALFFRCLERKPKAFLLPIADYDVVEVKETRMVLKNISTDKPIKIAEGKTSKDSSSEASKEESKSDGETKKSGRKRHSRKRRSSKTAEKVAEKVSDKEIKEEGDKEVQEDKPSKKEEKKSSSKRSTQRAVEENGEESTTSSSVVSVIFPPPPKIIGRKPPTEASEEVSKSVFPEAIDQPVEREPLQEEPSKAKAASSKDLPALEEVKEVQDEKEAVKTAEAESE